MHHHMLAYLRISESIDVLLGDFNMRIESRLCDSYDLYNPIYMRTLNEEELKAPQQIMGLSHGIISMAHIFSPWRGSSIVDHIMGSLKNTYIVWSFVVTSIGSDHTHLLFSLMDTTVTPTHHTPNCDITYHDIIYRGVLSMDPSTLSTQLTNFLRSSTLYSLPHMSHSTYNAKIGSIPQNS